MCSHVVMARIVSVACHESCGRLYGVDLHGPAQGMSSLATQGFVISEQRHAVWGAQLSEQDQVQAVMDRLQLAQDTDTPVMGRILNTVNRGYAVGIAGVVCFCPVTQCLLEVCGCSLRTSARAPPAGGWSERV